MYSAFNQGFGQYFSRTYTMESLLRIMLPMLLLLAMVRVNSGENETVCVTGGCGDFDPPTDAETECDTGSCNQERGEEKYSRVWGWYHESCRDIKASNPHARTGLYWIVDNKDSVYRTYCDMYSGGGGWTLVASVHENYLQGKCTTGDRWSSELGPNRPDHPNGDGNWENTRIFGAPESAASDDYKNQGYFNMKAKDVMLWHVPNDTPMGQYRQKSFMRYRTTNHFLHEYGGNLYHLFKDFWHLRYNIEGNGPSPPVHWDQGDNDVRLSYAPPNMRNEIEPGYIQFRAVNNERAAFAICPGVKMIKGDAEHSCIGSVGMVPEGGGRQCGDFAGKDWDGYASSVGWSSGKEMTESVVMIFYR